MSTQTAMQAVSATAQKPMNSWKRPKYLLFGIFGLMFLYALWNNERFLVQPDHPYWTHIEPFKWWLLPHGIASGLALCLGPLQFSDRLRRRYSKLHRQLGYLYVGGVFVGAPIGAYIQYFDERLGMSRSFTIATAADAVLWMLTTVVAMFFILQGRVRQHRQWMTRSFACAVIFLETRVIIGLTGWEEFAEIVVWACVAAAVPLADLVLQYQERSRRPTMSGKTTVRTA